MTVLLANGRPLTVSGSPLTETIWPLLGDMGVNWTHSWDVTDATFYTPSATEQADWGIDATPRVASIPDGSGNKPLLRDPGVFGQAYEPGNVGLPGPQWIEYSPRFRRPAVAFDEVAGGLGLHSMLSPQTTIANSADYFNPTGGFNPPFWGAFLVRASSLPAGAVDSILGSDPVISAGPTIGSGNQIGSGTDWSFACWYDDGGGITPDGTVRSGHTQSLDETVLLIIDMREGTNASAFYVFWRTALGVVDGDFAVGTVSVNAPSMAWRDLFFGFIDNHSYLTAAGVRDGTLTAPEVADVVAWADPWLVPPNTLPVEP